MTGDWANGRDGADRCDLCGKFKRTDDLHLLHEDGMLACTPCRRELVAYETAARE